MSANGYLTPAELTAIGSGLYLNNASAAGWFPMRDYAAEHDHVNLHTAAIASAYRPWAMQLDMRKNPGKYGINPNLGGLPGLPSRHGLGNCRDVPFGAPNNWMIAHGDAWGWHRPAATMAINDLNHWEFTPGTATAGGGAAPIPPDPAPQPKGRPMVYLMRQADAGHRTLLIGESGKHIELDAGVGPVPGPQENLVRRVLNYTAALNADAILGAEFDTVFALFAQVAPDVATGGGGSTPVDYFSDSDAAALQQNILNAVTTGDANILQAVSQLPAATLAAAGLQRIPQ